MKKVTFLFMMIMAFSGVTNVNAKCETCQYLATSATDEYDGTYSGVAVPTRMNGVPISSGKEYNCAFEISNGILEGDFTVGPHDVYMLSSTVITGVGTYPVTGYIILLGFKMPYTGIVTVTDLDGNSLSFTCNAHLSKTGLESDFSFTGTK